MSMLRCLSRLISLMPFYLQARLLKVIKNELLEIKRNFSDKRRTNIVNDISLAEIRTEDLIHVEDVIIVLSRNQDIKPFP